MNKMFRTRRTLLANTRWLLFILTILAVALAGTRHVSTTQASNPSVIGQTGIKRGGDKLTPQANNLLLHFHGSPTDPADTGCTGTGSTDVTSNTCSDMRTDPAGGTGAPAHWDVANPALNGTADRNVHDPNWIWNLTGPTRIGGPMTLQWWASCGACGTSVGPADWIIRVWADGTEYFEQRITATPDTPNVPKLLSTTVFVLQSNGKAITANTSIVIHIDPVYIDDQNNTHIYYDSVGACTPANASGPCDSTVTMPVLDPNDPVPTPTPTPTPGPFPTPQPATGIAPRYQNYAPPSGLGGDAGEPSIGVNWQTGAVMFEAHLQTLRVTFDDCPSPALATWADKSAPTSANSLDSILFTDHMRAAGDTTPQRTFVSQLTGQDSLSSFSDDDGDTWTPDQGGGIPSGVDHQTIGSGPYRSDTVAPPHPLYPNAVYYCSQDIATAFCARSDDGGATYGAGVPIYNINDCVGIHGHVKVAPNGTVYVPNRDCNGEAAVARSQDNGVTWAVKRIPTSSTTGFLVDPSVGIGTNDVGKPNGQTVNTIYLGYQALGGHAHIAVSHDEGDTWVNDVDVAKPVGVENTTFPEVVAGDDNRVAYAFLGTPVLGNYTDFNNYPVDAPWHLYVATSFDGGLSYHIVDATPNDPVQRGSICNLGTTSCANTPDDRNLLDFMDETVDAQGRVLVGYPDGCITPSCINNITAPGAHGPNDYTKLAKIARQSGGRRLFAAFDPTEPAAPAAPQVTAARAVGVVHVTWSTPDDGGSPITAYKIYRGTPGEQEILLTTVSGNVNNYDDTTASPDLTYYYRVTAINNMGEGLSCGLAFALVPESACRLPGRTVVADTSDSGANTPPDPRVDIQAINIAEPFLGAGVNKLVFTMQLAPSTMNMAPPNTQWFIIWDRLQPDADFDRYYVAGRSDATGTMSFEYGKFGVPLDPTNPNPNANTPVKIGDADSGTYDPITGLLRITLSNDKVESPANAIHAGQSLNNVNGRTYLNRPDPDQRSQNNANDITGNGSYTLAGNLACTPSVVNGGDVIISEFRLRGPTPATPLSDGAKDEFIELYNTTSNDIIVGGNGGWALAFDGGGGTPQIIATLPSGTGIPAHGHYLIANADGYTLSSYAAPDQTYTGDIPDNSGVALFNSTVGADLVAANRLDAAGFSTSNALFNEGTGLPSPGANDGEYSFVRKMSGTGVPRDTNDNASDFAFVSTNGGAYGGAQSTLGAPGPENSHSPIQRNATIKSSLPDPQCVSSSDPTSACGRVRDTSDTGTNKMNGTLSFRRKFTNKTGFTITKLRFRIVDITTTGGRAANEADLRALSSSTVTVTDSNNQSVSVLGTTIETPPAQDMGGGLNTTLVAALPAPLGTNNSVVVQLVTGVMQGGTFRFFINVEAVVDTSGTGSPARTVSTKLGAPAQKTLTTAPTVNKSAPAATPQASPPAAKPKRPPQRMR